MGTVFLDAIKEKVEVSFWHTDFFTALSLYNIYRRTFDKVN